MRKTLSKTILFLSTILLSACGGNKGGSSTSIASSSSAQPSSSKEETSEPISKSEESSSLSSSISSSSQEPVEHYEPRNENFMHFFIKLPKTEANYYFYCFYESEYFHVGVDVLDKDIVVDKTEMGYNDNIEFNIQRLCNDTKYSIGNTVNVMLNVGVEQGWVREAVSDTELGDNQISKYFGNESMDVIYTGRTVVDDGYLGKSLDIYFKYSIWGGSFASLKGLMTIAPAARNSDSTGRSEFRSYVVDEVNFGYSNTALMIDENGKPGRNNGKLLSLDQCVKDAGAYKTGYPFASSFADVSEKTNIREYKEGAQLFTDRSYLLYKESTPVELLGKSYLYNSIDSTQSVTVTKAGYLTVAIPHEGYANLHARMDTYEFKLVNKDNPGRQLAYHETGYIGITEQTDYYVKYCRKGDSYSFLRWAIVLSASRTSYPLNRWETELAQLHKMSSKEAIAEYAPSSRLWQGIPGIEWTRRDDGGIRLWNSLFSGGTREPTVYNYAAYYFSDDDGETWTYAFAIDFLGDKEDNARCFDPSIKYFDGKLYLYWNQADFQQHNAQTCCLIVNNPGIAIDTIADIEKFQASEPFFCAYGFKMNKPTVLTTGEWLFPSRNSNNKTITYINSSMDNGLTWTVKGTVTSYNIHMCDESTLVQIDDEGQELLMYMRTDVSYNQAVTYSHDGGVTWTESVDDGLVCPSSRQNSYRLSSGNIVFAHHYDSYNRENLYIALSEDGCKTYPHKLILDIRNGVSYPDITQDGDGNIYICWDYDRYGTKQVFFAKLSEEELLAIDGVETMDITRIEQANCITLQNQFWRVRGYIKDKNGNPIKDATISVGELDTTTNAQGYYCLDGLPIEGAGYADVNISAAGYVSLKTRVTNNDILDGCYVIRDDVTMEEKTNANYSGKVMDIFGEAVNGATVTLCEGVSTTTDASGSYAFNGVEKSQYNVSVSKAGYQTYTFIAPLEGTTDIRFEDVYLVKVTQADLGYVGGKNSERYKIFVEKSETGLAFLAKDMNGIDGDSRHVEFWINAYGFSKRRSINTFFMEMHQNGSFAIKNLPADKAALVDDTTGATCVVEGDWIKGFMPYAVLEQYMPEYVTISQDTEFGINVLSVTDTSTLDLWECKDIPVIKDLKTGTIDKFNTQDFVLLSKDNKLSNVPTQEYGLKEFAALVKSSDAYAGVEFSKDTMAKSNFASTNTQTKGGAMFNNRAASIHGFNDFRLAFLDGWTKTYEDVLKTYTVSFTSSGYVLLVYNPFEVTPVDSWSMILENFSNPGYSANPNHAIFHYVVKYVSAGSTITVPNAALCYIG